MIWESGLFTPVSGSVPLSKAMSVWPASGLMLAVPTYHGGLTHL